MVKLQFWSNWFWNLFRWTHDSSYMCFEMLLIMVKFTSSLWKTILGCWGNVRGTKEGSSVLLDICEVFTCWRFPWFGLTSLHLQVPRTRGSPSFISHMLSPAVLPTLSIYGCYARTSWSHYPRTHWLQLWYLVNTPAFGI